MEGKHLAEKAIPFVAQAPHLLLRSLKSPARLSRMNQLTSSILFPNCRSSSVDRHFRQRQNSESHNVGTWNILAFINVKSGGRNGEAVLEQLQRLIGDANVYELDDNENDPVKILNARRGDICHRIIAGGGDGTSAWIFDALDKTGLLDKEAVAILPLGTGNDMAGFLGWGYKYDKYLDLYRFVKDVCCGGIVDIDRWQIILTDQRPIDGAAEGSLPYDVFNNYLSVGSDAMTALHFHENRNAKPDEPRTRLKNIVEYMGSYLDTVSESFRSGISLADLIDHLECDGINLNARLEYLKPDTLLFLNIRSYAGGCRPWGNANEIASVPYSYKWRKQRADDGLLEVIAYTAVEFSDIALGGRGHRLSQCERVRFRTKTPMTMKVDGEPVLMQPCTIEIKLRNRALGIKRLRLRKREIEQLTVPHKHERPHSEPELDVAEF